MGPAGSLQGYRRCGSVGSRCAGGLSLVVSLGPRFSRRPAADRYGTHAGRTPTAPEGDSGTAGMRSQVRTSVCLGTRVESFQRTLKCILIAPVASAILCSLFRTRGVVSDDAVGFHPRPYTSRFA